MNEIFYASFFTCKEILDEKNEIWSTVNFEIMQEYWKYVYLLKELTYQLGGYHSYRVTCI